MITLPGQNARPSRITLTNQIPNCIKCCRRRPGPIIRSNAARVGDTLAVRMYHP